MMNSIAVYGSAFNPPHKGHMDVIQQLLDVFDHVLVVPGASHPFGKVLAPFSDRLNMTRLAVDAMNFPSARVSVSSIEQQILYDHHGVAPVYTIDVLDRLSAVALNQGTRNEYTFIIGPDNALPNIWSRFHRHKEIEHRYGVYVVEERLPVRSRRCRRLLESCNINIEQCQRLAPMLTNNVIDYATTKGLYAKYQVCCSE